MSKSTALQPFDRIVAEIKGRPNLSERGVCAGAGLDASALSVARRNGGKLALSSIEKLCAWLQKPVSWALGETPLAAAEGGSEKPDGFLSYNQLVRSDLNPRKDFGELTDSSDVTDPGLPELANSIRDNGILQNLLVRPAPQDGHWIIVFGERRWRAVGILVKEGAWDPAQAAIPVKIRDMTDEEHIAIAILENLQRKNMNPMEEAEGFAALVKVDKAKWTPATIAQKIGVTPRLVQQRLQLVKELDKPAKDALRAGNISVRQARVIVQAPAERRKQLLETAIEDVPEGEVKRELLDKRISAEHALFVIEGEGAVDAGPTITDEETGDLYFTSKKAFMREQGKAAKAQANLLKKEHGFGFVERVDWFYGSNYENAEGERAGVIYSLHPHTGEVEFHPGFKRRSERSSSYSYSNSGHRTAEQKARDAEKKRRRTAYTTLCTNIRAAIAKDPAIALRLALLTLLVDCEKENLPLHQSGVFRRNWGAKTVEPPAARLAALCSKGQLKEGADRAAVWKALESVTDNQAGAWLADAVSACIDRPGEYSKIPGTKKGFDDQSLLGCLAAALNVEVPEILLPVAKKKAAAE